MILPQEVNKPDYDYKIRSITERPHQKKNRHESILSRDGSGCQMLTGDEHDLHRIESQDQLEITPIIVNVIVVDHDKHVANF